MAVKLADGSTEYIKTPSATLSGAGGHGGMGGARRLIQMADNSSLDGVTLNLTSPQSSTGVYVYEADNVKVINNTINIESTTATSIGITVSSGAFASRPMNTEIRGNKITSTASGAGNYAHGMILTGSENTVLTNNKKPPTGGF